MKPDEKCCYIVMRNDYECKFTQSYRNCRNSVICSKIKIFPTGFLLANVNVSLCPNNSSVKGHFGWGADVICH